MRMGYLWIWVLGFVIANTWASILFKLAAENSGRKAIWYYVIGNIIGALGPLALTLGLKGGNPNVVYALCYGGAFTVLQIVSWRMFNQPLSSFQWAGIASVTVGIWLLQIGPK